MKWVICAGGEYGEPVSYRGEIESGDIVVAVDGGANFLWHAGVRPDYLVGDMDSILPEVLVAMKAAGVETRIFPQEKDYTDTQLALALAVEKGARRIAILGWTGDRFDHALANLYSGAGLVQRGIEVIYLAAHYRVYLTDGDLQLEGRPAQLVSLLALSEKVEGVTLQGFQYPLDDATLKYDNPFAVSNRILGTTAQVRVRQGVLAVFHYHT